MTKSRPRSVVSDNSDSEDKSSSKKISKLKRKRPEAAKIYKSAEFIEDSDEDIVKPDKEPSRSAGQNQPLKRQKAGLIKSQDDRIPSHKTISGKAKNSETSDPELPPLPSETETSNRLNKTSSSRSKRTTPKVKSSNTELSKDDVTIKRLKSLVNACGVRKNWSRVFQDCPELSQQIRKLKDILDELGMTGRLSMEQAKRIKQKREFAQELADVQSFERSMLSRGSRRNSVTKGLKKTPSESGDYDSEDEKPNKPKSDALQSICAFLEDQSDDD